MNLNEKITGRKEIYKGNIIGVHSISVELPDGNYSTRDLITHPGASVIIPVNENREVYMVTQYRTPIEKLLFEVPAGKLDNGEDPKVCAIRELKEETGLTAKSIKHLTSVYSTPGFCNEILHIYLATDLEEGDAQPDQNEFIRTEKIKLDKLVEMIFNQQITDSKSIIGILMTEKLLNIV